MTTRITRKLSFDAGHRLLKHEGKCRHLHGHHYEAEFTIEADLDTLGRVVDFSVVKEKVGGWIDEHLDHNVILNEEDPLVEHLIKTEPYEPRPFVVPYNPTAENIAMLLFYKAEELLDKHLKLIKVRVWETPSCYAEYSE